MPPTPKKPRHSRAGGFSKAAFRKAHRARETLTIKSGCLGPLQTQELEVRPLTLVIGRQGTGKSLLAQVLYLFRALPELLNFEIAARKAGSGRRAAKVDLDDALRGVIDGLRSARRRFANLTKPSVALEWSGVLAWNHGSKARRKLGFSAQHVTRQVEPRRNMRDFAAAVGRSPRIRAGALFVPAERILLSILPDPTVYRGLQLPLLFEAYARNVDDLYGAFDDLGDAHRLHPDVLTMTRDLAEVFGGSTHRTPSTWKWRFHDASGDRSIDLDMASSGQRASGLLGTLLPTLLALQLAGRLPSPFTLYLEEPEIHLHPRAEVALVEALALLVRQGVRVVVTTHSLTVLYTLNNLLLSSKLPDRPDTFLTPDEVEAWHLRDGLAVSLLDRDEGFIDERELGSVGDDLMVTMNRIAAELQRAKADDAAPR